MMDLLKKLENGVYQFFLHSMFASVVPTNTSDDNNSTNKTSDISDDPHSNDNSEMNNTSYTVGHLNVHQ